MTITNDVLGNFKKTFVKNESTICGRYYTLILLVACKISLRPSCLAGNNICPKTSGTA
jgi:hypothetical protein